MTKRPNGYRKSNIVNYCETVRVWRPVDYKDQKIEDFSTYTGRAISGVGTTRSIGSMTMTLLAGAQFNTLKQRLTRQDQIKLDPKEIVKVMQEKLDKRPDIINFSTDGIGLFGHKSGRIWEPVVRLGFRGVLGENPDIEDDLRAINDTLSDYNMPPVDPNRRRVLHISFGDIYTDHLSRGQGDNPHLLVPRGLTIPGEISLFRPAVDVVTYNNRDRD